jgi:hypothetical protein
MPRKGSKTINLPATLVDTYMLIFKENRDEIYKKTGINDFQGFMTRFLGKLLEEGELPKDPLKYLLT